MITDYTLLPPNASKLERALEIAMRPGADVLRGAKLVTTAKDELPGDDWPMFLVWEYGLEELLPYLPDPRAIIVTGIQWQRLKGTPASLRMAFEWLGLNSQVYQEEPDGAHWFEYQIDAGRVPTRAEMRNIVGLARLSAPIGTRLSRLFHGFDMRRAFWDYSAWDDGSLWSDDSGMHDDELDVILSFGRTIATETDASPELNTANVEITVTNLTFYEDKPIWDFSAWSEGPPILNYSAAVEICYAMFGEAFVQMNQSDAGIKFTSKATEANGWGPVPWGKRKWGEPYQISE